MSFIITGKTLGLSGKAGQTTVDSLSNETLLSVIVASRKIETAAAIRIGLSANILSDRGMEVAEIARHTGVHATTVRSYAARAKVLYVVSDGTEGQTARVWQQTDKRTPAALADDHENLVSIAQGDRAAAYTDRVVREAVAKRFGDMGTDENISEVTAALIADNVVTGPEAASLAAAVAVGKGYTVPKDEREPRPSFDSFGAWLDGSTKALDELWSQTDEGHPLSLFASQATAVEALIQRLGIIVETAIVVPDKASGTETVRAPEAVSV